MGHSFLKYNAVEEAVILFLRLAPVKHYAFGHMQVAGRHISLQCRISRKQYTQYSQAGNTQQNSYSISHLRVVTGQ